MPFGTATVVTNKGRSILVDRVQTTAGTYTAAPKFVRMGTGATSASRTAAVADTALSTSAEASTSGTESIVTTSVSADTYQVTGTVTATATRAVDEAGLFDAATVGNMFTSATFAVINLSSGDSIAFTWKAQIA